ncbi:MAG TPA: hypothetical protein VGD71_04490 [Kribbella sp.]
MVRAEIKRPLGQGREANWYSVLSHHSSSAASCEWLKSGSAYRSPTDSVTFTTGAQAATWSGLAAARHQLLAKAG